MDCTRPAGSVGKQERKRVRQEDTDTQGSSLLFLKVSPPLLLLGWKGRRMARAIDQSSLTGTWLGGGMGVGWGVGRSLGPSTWSRQKREMHIESWTFTHTHSKHGPVSILE